jgi:hypothetical protein
MRLNGDVQLRKKSIETWNKQIAGRRRTRATIQAEGIIQSRSYECEEATKALLELVRK